MRLLRTVFWIAQVAILLQLTGCYYSWRQVPLDSLTSEQIEGVQSLRVTTNGGWTGELFGPVVQDSFLVGMVPVLDPSDSQEFLITRLQDVQARRFDVGKTLAMNAMQTGVTIGVGYLLACFVIYPALGGYC